MSTEPDTNDGGGPERIGTDPVEGEGTFPFAGLTRFDDDVDAMTLPEGVWSDTSSMRYWAQNKVGRGDGVERDLDPSVLPERGLNTLIHELPRATNAEVVVRHPRTGEEYVTTKSKAVVDPDRLERIVSATHAEVAATFFDLDADDIRDRIVAARAATVDEPVRAALDDVGLSTNEIDEILDHTTMDDAVYNIPTQSYTIVNPAQFLRPLTEVLRDRDLGDKVFGEVRLDRGGGRATMDLYIDGQHVESPAFAPDREPVVVGLEIQWDFFGDWAVRACGQGIDWACVNAIHRMTDREIVKHSGDVESRQDWTRFWESLLDRLDEKRDQLARIIQQASEETLDFSELPDDIVQEVENRDAPPWTALYYYMGLPAYLAEHAGRELQTVAEDPYEPTWWEIHRGASYAVSHEDNSDRIAGGAFDDHARLARDALFNPAEMGERVVENYEASQDQDQDSLAEEGGGIAEIRNAFEDVRSKKETYEEWEDELREMGVDLDAGA